MPTVEEILAESRRRSSPSGPTPGPAAAPTDLDRMLPRLARDVSAGAALAERVDVPTIIQRSRERFAGSPFAGEVGLRTKRSAKTLARARTAPQVVERVTERRPGAPKEEVRTNLQRDLDIIRGAGKSALQGAMTVLDTPGRIARNAVLAAVDPETDFTPGAALLARGDTGQVGRFDARTRELAETDPSALGARGIAAGAEAMSEVAQPIGGFIGGGNAAILDVGGQTLGDVLGGSPLKAARELPGRVSKAAGRVGDLMFNDPEARSNIRQVTTGMATDPLMFIGGSVGGASKVAATQGARIARALGLSGDDALRAAQGLAKIAGAARTPDELLAQSGQVADWARALGGASPEAQARAMQTAARVLGDQAEFLGKGQLTVGPQVLGAGGQVEVPELVSRLTGGRVRPPEQLFRRTTEAARRRIGDKLTPQKRVALQERARDARVEAAVNTQRSTQEWVSEVAPLTPPRARAEELIRFHIDPDFTVAEGGAIQQVGKYIPRDALTDAERQWVDAVGSFFSRKGEALRTAGVISGKDVNPLSGLYFPRRFRPDLTRTEGVKRMLDPKAWRVPEASAMKQRGQAGGHPLGRKFEPGLAAELDPSKVAVRYVAAAEQTASKDRLRMWVADRFGEQPGTHRLHQEAAFEPMMNSSGQRVMVPNDIVSQVEKNADRAFRSFSGKAVDRVISSFKEFNTIPVPRYHLVNMVGDATMMYTAGMRDPRRFSDAMRVIRGKSPNQTAVMTPTGPVSVGEARALLTRSGIIDDPAGVAGRFDLDVTRTQKGALRAAKTAERRGQRARGELADIKATRWLKDQGAGEVFKDVASLGLRRPGRALASRWDETSKTALFLDRLSKGDNPMQARVRVFETLFDYADHDQMTRWFRRFFPFGTYTSKAVRAIPKQLARQPHAATMSGRVTQALMGEPPGGTHEDQAPSFQSEMSGTQALGPAHRQAVSSMAEAMTGKPIDPGFGVSMRVRDPLLETPAMLLELLAAGNVDPLILGVNPLIGAAQEFVSEQDFLTKRPLERTRPSALAPAGTPGVPAALEASPGQAAWATRYLPQFFMSPLATELANQAIGTTTLGRHRDRAIDEENRQALRMINMLLGLPLTLTTGTEEIINAAQDPRVERAAKAPGTIRRQLKRERRRERLETEP